MTGSRAAALACLLAAALVACTPAPTAPTAADAEAFVRDAEARLATLRQEAARAAWLGDDLVDPDAGATAAADATLKAVTAELARAAVRFDGLDLPAATARKLTLLKTGQAAAAAHHPAHARELADILAGLDQTYRAGAYCFGTGEDCLDRTALEQTVAGLRDTDALLDLWHDGRALASSMPSRYERLVELANAGAAELGHADAGERWRSAYGLPPDDLRTELERLWDQVRPLYESLHCLVRGELGEAYGTAIVPPGEAIPAHLLGDLGDGRWSSVHALVSPGDDRSGNDLTRRLERGGANPREMVRYAERFFESLGFDSLPATVWERSLFVDPTDRGGGCRAGAWNLDGRDDLRLRICIEPRDEDFVAVHRDLGRAYYQWAYRSQDPLFRTAANGAFLAAAGNAAALSVTPDYLVEAGLLDRAPPDAGDIPFLLRRALDEIPALPFGLSADRWRWRIFSGEVAPARYNRAWWELREAYQGVRAPLPRHETDFDAGATRRIAANEPYAGEFLAGILQYQFHDALCAAAGDGGPLHRCSIFGSPDAGARLQAMMELGASRPWPAALEAIAGARRMDASALLEYFAPLAAWLDERNAGRSCGW